jgi:hypothetical protein
MEEMDVSRLGVEPHELESATFDCQQRGGLAVLRCVSLKVANYARRAFAFAIAAFPDEIGFAILASGDCVLFL